MIGPTYADCFFTNTADFTGLSSFTAESSLLGGRNQQPTLWANFLGNPLAAGKSLAFRASGIVACTGTPTYTFQARLGTVQGSSDLTGTSIGVSAAITMQSGVTNRMWDLWLDVINSTPGQGTGNCTVTCRGVVESFDGFASPNRYPMLPTTPPTATWTATVNGAATLYFNLSVSCSASNASNAITCKMLQAYSWN
jgi:hypothetical protein